MAASSSQDNEWTVVERDSSRRFARYEKIIGGGSAKTVYKGFDHLFGTEIAWSKIKVAPGTEETFENLVKLCAEPLLLMLLDHDNITKCYHFWIDEYNKVVNMITEYCCSGNLAMYCKEHIGNLLGNTAIKNWFRQVLNALHYLHAHEPPVTHRDVKCVNIFVTGNKSTVKLGDFGLAKVFKLGSKPEFDTDIYWFGESMTRMMITTGVQFSICDPLIKQMLSKCKIPPPDKPTALDLLVNDRFLADDTDVAESSNARSSAAADILNVRERVVGQVARLLIPPTEVVKEIEIQDRKLKLQGIRTDYVSNSITLKLIIDLNNRVRTVNFEFILGVDTISDIMDNMKEEFGADEVVLVSEIMEQLVTEFQDDPDDSSNTTCIAGEDWSLQELYLEETSNDDNRRRSNKKLSSWLCCKKF